jgi:biopolymer transport protein ExbD
MNRSSLLVRRRRRPEINIVPLIDISVKLIFFFLVSMQFKGMSTLNLTLPTSETAGATRIEELLLISVDKDGVFEVAGKLLDKDGLDAAVRAIDPALRLNPVVIRSDRLTPVQSVVDAMDACRRHGFNTLRFQTQ